MSQLENGPPPPAEWVVTFADMMTLLLAFFVLLVSLNGKGNDEKTKALLDSIRKQFGDEVTAEELAKKQEQERFNEEPAGKESYQLRMAPPPSERRIGGAIAFSAPAATLDKLALEEIERAAQELRGKLQRVELRASAVVNDENPDPVQSQELALKRCQNVMNALAAAGIDSGRIRVSITAGVPATSERAKFHEADVEILMLDEFADNAANTGQDTQLTAASLGAPPN